MRTNRSQTTVGDLSRRTPSRMNRSLTSAGNDRGTVSAKRSCACGGGCPRCKDKLPIQAKLDVSQPGDALEREADRIADSIMQTTSTDAVSSAAGAQVMRRTTGSVGSADAASAAVPEALQETGQPLDAGTRDFFEPRLGDDLRHVRVHTGTNADSSARALKARAYTFGRDVVFRAGEYKPHTAEGRRLLAHELVHVQQQARIPSLARQIMRAPHIGCDSATTGVADADDRIDKAKQWATDAALKAWRAMSEIDATTLALVDAHFHCPSPEQVKTINENLGKMAMKIGNLDPSCQDASADACARGRDFGLSPTMGFLTLIDFCPSAFSGDEFRLARGFLTAAGRLSILSENCADTDPCYTDAAVGAGTMLGNIDSYVRLSMAVNGVPLATPSIACTSSAKRLREVKKALAPQLPADVCDYNRCDQHEQIHGDLRQAIARTERALAALKGKPSGATERALEAYFMDDDKTTAATVRERLACILGALQDTLANERYGCTEREAPIANVGGAEKPCEDNFQRLCLNKPYFGFGDRGRITTLIHECGHRVGLSTDAAGTPDVYSFDRGFLNLTTDEALSNTDSYAMFVNAIDDGVPATLLFPIMGGTLGATIPSQGHSDAFARVYMGAELQHPRLWLFHPELRVGLTFMHNPFTGSDEVPSHDADITASVLLGVRIGNPGWRGPYLSLRGGGLLGANTGAKKPSDPLFSVGREANIEAGWRWGKFDVSAVGGVMEDRMRDENAQKVYYGGVSFSILTDFSMLPKIYK
jgi:hypothetical protein